MSYSFFVAVCLVIHIVINIDIFRRKATISLPAIRAYRVFVLSIFIYFITDFLWGVFESAKLPIALNIDTFIYFLTMGFTILTWTRYVVKYLESPKWFEHTMLIVGNLFFLAEVILLIINIFIPILYSVDPSTCEYKAYRARNIMLYVQTLLYSLLVIYSFIMALRKKSYRRRYTTITLYSAIMFACIVIQIYQPLLPVYSVGCLVGATLLNSFVISDIKEEYKAALEETRGLAEQKQHELNETIIIANTDPLTGVKNKHAYVEEEERIDKLIARGEMEDFAVVVFDLNGLKHINDTKGHDAGDIYIIDSCRLIEKYFGENNLYRFGGDEFVLILTGDLYENRSKTLSDFERNIDESLDSDLPIISSGMSKYRKGEDNTYHAVFYRADKIMYSRKEILKEHQNNQ